MRSSLSSYVFLLALGVGVFCGVAEGEADFGDCCSKKTFCCGGSCLPNHIRPRVWCGPGSCCDADSEPPVDDPEPCICTLEYEPLCNPETGVTFGNICEAVTCGGQDEADLVEGECEDEDDDEDDCCPEGNFCCGDACLLDGTATFAPCGESKCCPIEHRRHILQDDDDDDDNDDDEDDDDDADDEDDDEGEVPRRPQDACCPEDEFCCGSDCTPRDDKFIVCPAFESCCPDLDCFCTLVYDPVCSESTGQSFSNSCFAECSDDPGPFSPGFTCD